MSINCDSTHIRRYTKRIWKLNSLMRKMQNDIWMLELEKRMKKEKHFNKIEEKILRVVFQHKILMTTGEVAKECGLSFPTSQKYLIKLRDEGYLVYKEGKNESKKNKTNKD